MTFLHVNLTIRDAKGQESTQRYYMDADTIDGERGAIEWAQAFATQLDPFINGAIVDIGIRIEVPLPGGIKTIPGGSVEAGLMLTFEAEYGFKNRYRWATFKETEYVGNDRDMVIDTSDPLLAELLLTITNPVEAAGDWLVAVTTHRGEDIQTLLKAQDDFRRDRKSARDI